MNGEIHQPEAGSPEMPDRIFQRKGKNGHRAVDSGVSQVSPIGLKQYFKWSDVPDALVRLDDQNIIEDKGVRQRIGIADGDEQRADNQRATRRHAPIGPVHPTVPWALALDRWST